MFKNATIILIAIAAVACTTAPKAAPVADPRFAQLRFRFYPGIPTIDGNPSGAPSWNIPLAPRQTKINLVPGEHDLAASLRMQNGSAFWNFRFLFEAGHSYLAESDIAGSRLKITDEQAGVSVALRH
jgi:hypothetical protein